MYAWFGKRGFLFLGHAQHHTEVDDLSMKLSEAAHTRIHSHPYIQTRTVLDNKYFRPLRRQRLDPYASEFASESLIKDGVASAPCIQQARPIATRRATALHQGMDVACPVRKSFAKPPCSTRLRLKTRIWSALMAPLCCFYVIAITCGVVKRHVNIFLDFTLVCCSSHTNKQR